MKSRRKTSSPQLALLIKILTYILLLIPYMVIPTLTILNLDPLFLLMNTTICEACTVFKFCSLLLRTGVCVCATSEVAKWTIGFLVIGLIVVCSSSQSMFELVAQFECFDKQHFRNRHNRLLQCVALYCELQLWLQYINQNVCYFGVPPLVFCGVATMILATYTTLRAFTILPILIYMVAPIVALGATIFLVTLLPMAGKSFEMTNHFLQAAKRRCTGKYDKRLTGSLRPFWN